MSSIESLSPVAARPPPQEPLSVFDLPNLRNKPSYQQLFKVLHFLEVKPSAWVKPTFRQRTIAEEVGISRYLMAIVSNPFDWLKDAEEVGTAADQAETLRDLASKRVAERCGRSAMPEISRTWAIPASATLPEQHFHIREPSLSEDKLGLKTWGTAYAIAKKLEYFGDNHFNHLLGTNQRSKTRVLELGAGTGLVGIAAGTIWATNVVLTDLEEIVNNLQYNIEKNLTAVASHGGSVSGKVLDWKNSDLALTDYASEGFEIIVAADSLYDEEHTQLIPNMIKKYLKPLPSSRALVAVPLRDSKTISMAAKLRACLENSKLELLGEGWEVCHDDWGSTAEDEDVKCWWGIFGFSAFEE